MDRVMMQGQDLSSILHRFSQSDFAFSRFDGLEDDGRITPNSILEDPLQYNNTGSGGTTGSSEDLAVEEINGRNKNKKKEKHGKSSSNGGGGFLPQIVMSLSNRRKGTPPQRSPLS